MLLRKGKYFKALFKLIHDSNLSPVSANESKEIQQKDSLYYKHTHTQVC